LKVIVLGHTGMLGRYVYKYFLKRFDVGFNDQFLLPRDIDVVKNNIIKQSANIVINCIGVVKQRRDVSQEVSSYVNSIFPHVLSDFCTDNNINMIHISTDCVFNGSRGQYLEDDLTDAHDFYGVSKILGEPVNCSVIRSSFVGEELKRKLSLLEWFKSKAGSRCLGFENHYWNGITALQLAKVIEKIINTKEFWKGIRHVFTDHAISKFDLLCLINKAFDLKIDIKRARHEININRVLNTKFKNFQHSLLIPPLDRQIRELSRFDI